MRFSRIWAAPMTPRDWLGLLCNLLGLVLFVTVLVVIIAIGASS